MTFAELIETDEDTFTNASKYLGGVQTFAPTEMAAVVVIISVYAQSRNDRPLSYSAVSKPCGLHYDGTAKLWRYILGWLEDMESIRGAEKQLSKPSPSATPTSLHPNCNRT
jgi:hypothetical protein